MTKKVLLTGATGFVGRHVMNQLSNHDVGITLVVRNAEKIQTSHNSRVEEVIVTDNLFAESVEWWKVRLKGIDTIIHVAWYAEPTLYLLSPKNLECHQGTLNIALAAAQSGVRRFVGIGTCFEYDVSKGMLSVDTPIKPLTPYAGAKSATYMILSRWLPSQGVEFSWCRLFYLYGEGEDHRRLVPYLHKKLSSGEPAELTSGHQIRDFMDVADAARQIVCKAFGNESGAFNVCSGMPVTVRQLAENIADEYGRRDLLKFGARPDNLIDPICIVGVKN